MPVSICMSHLLTVVWAGPSQRFVSPFTSHGQCLVEGFLDADAPAARPAAGDRHTPSERSAGPADGREELRVDRVWPPEARTSGAGAARPRRQTPGCRGHERMFSGVKGDEAVGHQQQEGYLCSPNKPMST